MLKRNLFFLVISMFILIGCGGGGSSSNGSSSTTNTTGENSSTVTVTQASNTISGIVDDDPVSEAEVYIDFGDGTTSTKVISNINGLYELKLSNEDLAKINPEIPEGADGPRDNILLVAEKNGKILRSALTRDISNGQIVYITNDTEAYAQYLESIGKFDTILLTEFNDELEKGRIKDSSEKASFIKDIREDVKKYFYGGEKPTADALFTKALTHLGKDKVSSVADDKSYISTRSIMSGGDILLPTNVNISSDDITITSKDNGRFILGDGNDSSKTIYLKVQVDEVFKLIPIDIKAKVVTQIASQLVTPQQGATLGDSAGSISAVIPPFALNEDKNITFNKVESEGESSEGKVILDMQPSGTTFEMPITVTIKYSDFGIEDPESVEWQYGSADDGYEKADIVSIDTVNKLIYLNVEHFSNLVIKKRSGQSFLDLGENFIEMIPRRNFNFAPKSSSTGSNITTILSNKLFPGSSLSNHVVSGQNGGQCVQTVRTILWSLFYERTGSQIKGNANDKIIDSNIDNYLRKDFDDIQTGDLVWVYENTGIAAGIGHTFSVIRNAKGDYTGIESNDESGDNHKMNIDGLTNVKYKRTDIWNNRFGIREKKLTKDNFKSEHIGSSKKNLDYVVYKNPRDSEFIFSEKDLEKDINSAKDIKTKYKTVAVNPDEYYFLNGEPADIETYKYGKKATPYLVSDYNGIVKKGNTYVYNPDLLPVTPLKVGYDANNNGTIFSTRDARYEIYATFEIDSAKLSSGKELANNNNSNYTLEFNGQNLLLLNEMNKPAVKQFTMVDISDNNKWLTLDTKKLGKILFSPTVIDDYYVDWGDVTPRIGFRNSYNKDRRFGLDFKGDYVGGTTLKDASIYRTRDALNGYFMTLGTGETAKWFFALAGEHSIFVNLPSGNSSENFANAEYTLHKSDGSTQTLFLAEKIDISNEDTKNFANWYPLVAKGANNKNIEEFMFKGNEYVSVSPKNGVIEVDAIRLDATDGIEKYIGKIRANVKLANSNDHTKYVPQIKVKEVANTGAGSTNTGEFGTPININLRKPLNQATTYKITTSAKPKSTTSRSLRSTSTESYKPQVQYITVQAGETEVNLPSVTLYKNETKPSVKLKVSNALTGAYINNANITVKFGTDRIDSSVAYSGSLDSNGIFEVSNMPYGQYSVVVNSDGYISTSQNITVDENIAEITQLSLSPVLADGEMRIRLSWGADPGDLDSHLVKKVDTNMEYHIYYSSRSGTNGDSLDLDDTDGYGPETTTISHLDSSAIYTYYVHHFSGNNSIKDSSAGVKVSFGNSERTFYPPSEDGIYWKVFEIENGVINPCTSNCMTSDTNTIVRTLNKTSNEFSIFKNLPAK